MIAEIRISDGARKLIGVKLLPSLKDEPQEESVHEDTISLTTTRLFTFKEIEAKLDDTHLELKQIEDRMNRYADCDEIKDRLTNCYIHNYHQSLRCSNIATEFKDCVRSKLLEFLNNDDNESNK